MDNYKFNGREIAWLVEQDPRDKLLRATFEHGQSIVILHRSLVKQLDQWQGGQRLEKFGDIPLMRDGDGHAYVLDSDADKLSQMLRQVQYMGYER